MSKDPLKRMVEMMTYVADYKDGLIEERFIRKFGNSNYEKFKKFCIGGTAQGKTQYYATGPDSPIPTVNINLSTDGVRRLYELRQILVEERRNKLLLVFTFLMALATFFQAVFIWISINVSYADLKAKGITIPISELSSVYILILFFIIMGGLFAYIIWDRL